MDRPKRIIVLRANATVQPRLMSLELCTTRMQVMHSRKSESRGTVQTSMYRSLDLGWTDRSFRAVEEGAPNGWLAAPASAAREIQKVHKIWLLKSLWSSCLE